MRQVVIAGAGPTGAAFALLLVQRGMTVTLVEAAPDFRRVFRGEGLMPSGMDAIAQMGLSEILENIPHRELSGWEFILGKRSLFRVDEPVEPGTRPCTLVSQPPLLEALVAQAKIYPGFEFIQGVPVKDLLWDNNKRVAGVKLADSREIKTTLVIGADGRNSVIRERAGIKLDRLPKNMDVLWFKLAASPKFVEDNVFCALGDGKNAFAVFHGAEEGKLHLAWTISPNETIDTQRTNTQKTTEEWAQIFASTSPSWLAEHFIKHANTVERPIKLSVVVGRCPQWYAPGVLLLGDAAHPMAPIRAQGINVALRDVIIATNYLVPLFKKDADKESIDTALSQIQAEREPEIIRVQQLQAREGAQTKLIPKNPQIRSVVLKLARLLSAVIRKSWIQRQHDMRHGVKEVKLSV